MNVRKLGRRWFSGILALILIGACASEARAQAQHVRWDIVILAPPTVSSGGTASAQAQDGSTIAMTGSGTFVAPGGGSGSNGSTTGGGMWTTCTGAVCATGSYAVTGLVRWEQEPGKSLPPILTNDTIDDGTPSAGLVVLRIAYSDGSHGILVVSCNLPFPAPNPQMFEGITATKGFVDYKAPVPGGVTLFHVR